MKYNFCSKKIFNANQFSAECVKHLESYWKGQNFITWLVFSDDIISQCLLADGITPGEVVLLYNNCTICIDNLKE